MRLSLTSLFSKRRNQEHGKPPQGGPDQDLLIQGVLVDPFTRQIHNVVVPDYAKTRIGGPVDPEAANRTWDVWYRLVAGDQPYHRGGTALRYDCRAIIDDEGLLRAEPAFWRIRSGPQEDWVMRAARYLILGMSPDREIDGYHAVRYECDCPSDLGLDFWLRHVEWIDYAERHEWCRERGIRS